MRNIKSQKGAISLFVILSMLFFLAFMLGVFSITSRRNAAQLEAVRETAKIYASGIDANTIYDSMLATTSGTAIPITNIEQLKEVKKLQEGTNTTATTNYTINGKLYSYKKGSSYYLANDIILDMKTELDGKSAATSNVVNIYDYILYDISKYKIDLNNHNIYYKLKDNSLWKCVFYQDIGESSTSANRFTSVTEAGKCYTAKKYSILANGIEEFSYPWTTTTNYEFLLAFSSDFTSGTIGKFDIANEEFQRWRQLNSPAKEKISNGTGSETATGYSAVKTSLGTSNYWGGLTLSTSDACYINGSVGHANWFWAVGVIGSSWHSTYGIPTTGNTATTAQQSARECILFVRAK